MGVEGRVEGLRKEILGNDRIARYVGDMFPAQVEKVWVEMGGEAFPNSSLEAHRREHEQHHSHRHPDAQ